MGRRLKNGPPPGVDTCACSRCGETRPAVEFYWRSDGSRNPWCKTCMKAYSAERNAARAARGEFKKRPDSIPCEACGAEIETTIRNPTQRWCKSCSEARRREWIDARNEAEKAARLASKPERRCPHCGSDVPASARADAAYCSERCSQASHNALRKASWKVRGAGGVIVEVVSRAYIVERDRSRCHLCGKRCAPEEIHLDHLVPLSLGGDHSAANVRVACARCNTSKRASARDEQLLLVG